MVKQDFERLRHLGGRVAEIAAMPAQSRKTRLWYEHNALRTDEPLVFCDPENGWREIITPETLECADPVARGWEFELMRRIHHAEVLKDDFVVDANFAVPLVISSTGWGVKIEHIGEGAGQAYKVKPAIVEYERDFEKLHFPKFIVDEAASEQRLALAHEVFDGILSVKSHMTWWWTLGMTWSYIDLRGLEEFMCDMITQPDWVHRMMEFLCQGTLNMLDDLTARGLLCQNNGNHYVGSGGFGFTQEINDVPPGSVTPKDMWGFVESQETVSISPAMYGEFVFPYHKRIAERFALNCYGCCEPYDGRWKYAKQLHALRRVSVSPWSDHDSMVSNLGKRYIASIKLNPSPLSRPVMDEVFVRGELQGAVRHARSLVSELIMKDCHTLGNNPDNARRWVEIAREEIAKV